MYTMVLADIIKRYHLLRNERAILLTGTDEHGMKVGGRGQSFRGQVLMAFWDRFNKPPKRRKVHRNNFATEELKFLKQVSAKAYMCEGY